MSEKPEFGRPITVPRNRAVRAARLGGMALNVAGNMAAQRLQATFRGERAGLRDLLITPANIGRITNELSRMRGAAMKLGQLISMDAGDVLPPELSQIMARLRAEADYMPPAQLKTVLTKAWGPDWLRLFAKFDVRPIAAASIGQVHRAQLKDGRDVAIKVQYPGVAQSIDSDVANVAALVKLSGLIPKGFEIDPYIEEARKQLHEETDYLREAEHLNTFRRLLRGADRYELPEVHEDFTVSSILTMSFIDSQPLEKVADLDETLRNQISGDLVTLVLRELFEFGIVQSDPNFANFRFNPRTQRLVLLDFGATRAIDAGIAEAYRALLLAGLAQDMPRAQSAAERLGLWDDTTDPQHIAQLTDMMRVVFEAVREGIYDFSDPTLTRYMNTQGMALAESGFVPPSVPIDVPFVQRKLAGVFLIAANLKARLDLQQIIRSQLELSV
ncbi:MAG: AarF/ABC1/UbiB kinase family protein [Pseudomonadota bacterium]